MDIWDNKRKYHQQIPEPHPKRISTPAGQRLSVILENGGDPQKKARDGHRSSTRKSGLLTTAALGDVPRESTEGSSGYSYSVWSDGEKFSKLRNSKQIAKRGGWKRIALIVLILILIIVAVAVGLAVGLKKKKSVDDTSNQASPAQSTTSPNAVNNPNNPNNPSPTAPSSPSSTPSSFPLGTYSLVTFLDTVQTNCTSNPATWTCYPYTVYNDSPSKSLATFNWIITSSSGGSYQISSTDNPFSISFKNADMELLDEGQDTERYRVQMTQTKTVSPSEALTRDNAAVECAFDGTSLQASLYTKMAKGYPDTEHGDPTGNPSYSVWPFAVRVEQAVGGGEAIPSCYKLQNGQHGDQVTQGLEAQDAGNLCSCLYRNFRTPDPNH
ncbi:hypothetical protein EJ04DRAFT_515961 [Polyplosphaeria fusca]|uniref:Tat pathway signal sequence n=1 Tax=Polyplosphaeria fusca TaxID=682080 RepID=A0A9P4QR34_9PLEO|nr:hypothetical protein EJ04DRAFT_515961 [Polyplosphaeria fusca]